MAELKPHIQSKVPCPFCGGTELLTASDELRIECLTCGAEGPIPLVYVRKLGPVAAAYDKWNKRASDPEEGQVVRFMEIPFTDGVQPGDGILVESCPFCGKEGRPVCKKTANGMEYHVECSCCHSRGRDIGKKYGSDLNQIKLAVCQWNKRASDPGEAVQ